MKSWVLLLLLFGASLFSLSAQTTRNIPLYVPPTEGVGSEPEDNNLFIDLLTRELGAWNFTLMDTRETADYSLVSMIAPSSDADEEYVLALSFQDKEGITLYEETLRYTTMEEVNAYIPSMLLNMLSNIFVMYIADSAAPEEIIDPDAWRKKSWYMGMSAFWSPRLYHGSFLSKNLANFGFDFSAEFHFIQFAAGKLEFLKYISVGTGMEFVPDWIIATKILGDEYRNTILQIPLRFSFVWRAGRLFMHQPFLGIHFNIPFYKDTTPAVVSWDIGFQFGIKAGPGIAYAQALYSMDFGSSGLDISRRHDPRIYQRYVMHLGIGYKYDLVGMIANLIKNRPPKQKSQKTPPEDIADTETVMEAAETAIEDTEISDSADREDEALDTEEFEAF